MNDSITNPPPTWAVTTLGDCATWYSGGTPSTSVATYWNGDIPWITASSLHDFYLRNSERKVTELGLQNGTRLMPSGTIIFVVRGMSLKSEFRVGIARRPVAFGQDCKAIIAKEGIDPLFLANVLRAKTAEVLRLVDEASHGTGRLQTDVLQNLEIPLPPFPVQRRIAEILGRLDDKIEVNRRINATLEAMAQALYRHWFVEFGPFQDGEFMESELGAIPQGWEIRSVYDQAQFVNGASLLKFQPNAERRGLPIVKIAESKAGVTRQTLFTEREMDSKYRIDDGEILFSWSGNPDTSIDVFIWTGGPAWLNQHIFRVLPIQPEEKYMVYYGLKQMLPVFAEIARNKQTTGLGHVTVRDLKSLQVVLPPLEIVGAFNSRVGPLYAKHYLNLVESRKLTEARDYLLPKLLMGEIKMEDAENAVVSHGSVPGASGV